jgi:hypothetical protein
MRLMTSMVVLCVLALAVSSFGPASSTAYADNTGATVNNDFTCWITLAGTYAVGVGQCVTNSAGNTNCTCQANYVSGPQPDQAEHYSGFSCNANGVYTLDSSATKTPNGDINYRCQIH